MSIKSKDAAIATLAREEENVFAELKGAQRIIRNLRQQLNDERTIYSKEKEHLVEEIQKLSRNKEIDTGAKSIVPDPDQSDVQNKQIDSLHDQLLKKDEIIYKLCSKYMKLKSNKTALHIKLQRLKTEVERTHHTTVYVLEENKHKMHKLFKEMFPPSSVSSNSKKYIKLLKRNIELHNENARLKLCLLTHSEQRQTQTKLADDHDYNPSHVSEEDVKCSSKLYRRYFKWHTHKLKKLNDWPSPALLRRFSKEHKLFSAKERHSFRKSRSMPCLCFDFLPQTEI